MNTEASLDLRAVRMELELSQSELADLIGVSTRTVQSCEQAWRKPGPAVEKALIVLLMAHRLGADLGHHHCWEVLGCSAQSRRQCFVFRCRQGQICWLLSGNLCQGKRLRTWREKKSVCLRCPFFLELLPGGIPTVAEN